MIFYITKLHSKSALKVVILAANDLIVSLLLTALM